MAISIKNIKVGSTVVVRPCFGTGKPIKVVVTDVHENVKNNYAGISYDLNQEGEYDSHWAYLDQIDSVVTY